VTSSSSQGQDPGPRKDQRRLRETCESRLGEIGLPIDCDIDSLCERISQQRGRPIHRIPIPMRSNHPCGFWVATEHADFILYEANTSKAHQEHIIVHELAHIICCHRGSVTIDDASAELLFPDLDPGLVRDMLRRSGYSDNQEREAEILASMILERVNRHPRTPDPATDADNTEELMRIERALTYRTSRSRDSPQH
jgi:Zn-dependent peptidase ImmA (M78 family)